MSIKPSTQTIMGTGESDKEKRPAPHDEGQGAILIEQMPEKVLQHLADEIALGSTNERKPS